jgi:DNA-binding transcriptional ArsR family regulator
MMRDLADNPMRTSILDRLQSEPGLSFSELYAALRATPRFATSLGFGTLQWHLYRLERARLVSSRRSGKCRRYYPKAGPWHADLDGFALLQAPSLLSLARWIAHAPGIGRPELHRRHRTGGPQTAQAVSYGVRRLAAAGLVTATPAGRGRAYAPTPRLERLLGAMGRAGLTGSASLVDSSDIPLVTPRAGLAAGPISAFEPSSLGRGSVSFHPFVTEIKGATP